MAKKNGASKGAVGALIGFILAAAAVMAFIKGTGVTSLKETVEVFQGNAPTFEEFIDNLVGEDLFTWPGGEGNSGNGGSGSNGSGTGGGEGISAGVSPSDASAALASLQVASAASVDYNRDEWRHWDNITSCWTVREEVLYRQAEPGSLTVLDKNKQPTTSKSEACEISGGEWVDPYTGDLFTNPSDLDIDHMIPLGYAARHGGQEWNEDKKRDFANSLETGHLLAVSASANRSKSDRGPSEWKPQDSYYCDYATHWISVSDNWNLSTTQEDKSALESMLATC